PRAAQSVVAVLSEAISLLTLTLREAVRWRRGHHPVAERGGDDAARVLESGRTGRSDGAHRAHTPPLRGDRLALAVAPLGCGVPAVHGRRRDRRATHQV